MYRTLIRFVVLADKRWYVAVPAWGLHALIGIRVEDLPKQIRSVAKPGMRCHAKVNIGTEANYELAFEDWEL